MANQSASKNGVERIVRPHPTWSYLETLERIKSIPDRKVRVFCAIQYLNGCRIEEALSLRPEWVEEREDGLMHIINLNLKQRTKEHRDILIEPDKEPFYCACVIEFLAYAKTNNYKTLHEYVGVNKRWLQRKINKYLNIKNHSLRHLRATHMGKQRIPGTIHQGTTPYIKKYFGWKNIRTAAYYIDNLTTEDILERYHENQSLLTSNREKGKDE